MRNKNKKLINNFIFRIAKNCTCSQQGVSLDYLETSLESQCMLVPGRVHFRHHPLGHRHRPRHRIPGSSVSPGHLDPDLAEEPWSRSMSTGPGSHHHHHHQVLSSVYEDSAVSFCSPMWERSCDVKIYHGKQEENAESME